MEPRKILEGRRKLGLSQAELADRLPDTYQVKVSLWENGRARPNSGQVAALRALFNPRRRTRANDITDGSSFADWVAEQRRFAGLSRRDLAAATGISEIQVYNIETGRTLNPREKTRKALERVLGEAPHEAVEAAEQEADIPGVGQLTDFNPHDEADFPSDPGVYVFYDISERPVYVGQSGNIKRPIRADHLEKFWYKSPIVERAAYVRVADETLRKQLEETLIKFLKSNAVINKKGVSR
jgi:ribosome-binding protein aMBF1 (putative translation factor)